MRRPTPLDEQLAWWRNAIATNSRAITDDLPRCGWFKERLEARSKTWVPARIWLEQSVDWATGELTEPERFVLELRGRTERDQNRVAERYMRLTPCSLDEWKWWEARWHLRNGYRQTAYTYA